MKKELNATPLVPDEPKRIATMNDSSSLGSTPEGVGNQERTEPEKNSSPNLPTLKGYHAMANWKYNLKFKQDRDAYEGEKITLPELSKRIADKLKKLSGFADDQELQGIVLQFEDNITDRDEFDDILDQLYDWGDQEIPPYGAWPQNKKAWIGFA